jgi:hypothetical protein
MKVVRDMGRNEVRRVGSCWPLYSQMIHARAEYLGRGFVRSQLHTLWMKVRISEGRNLMILGGTWSGPLDAFLV